MMREFPHWIVHFHHYYYCHQLSSSVTEVTCHGLPLLSVFSCFFNLLEIVQFVQLFESSVHIRLDLTYTLPSSAVVVHTLTTRSLSYMTGESCFSLCNNLVFRTVFCCGELCLVLNVIFMCRCSAKGRHSSAVRRSQTMQAWSLHVTYSAVLARHRERGYTC